MIPLVGDAGTKHESTVLPNGRVARLSYEYLNIFWFIGYAVNLRWAIVGRDPADDVSTTREAIEAEYGVHLSEPGTWQRYGIFFVAVFILVFGIAALALD